MFENNTGKRDYRLVGAKGEHSQMAPRRSIWVNSNIKKPQVSI